MRAGVEPREVAAEPLHLEPADVEAGAVNVGDPGLATLRSRAIEIVPPFGIARFNTVTAAWSQCDHTGSAQEIGYYAAIMTPAPCAKPALATPVLRVPEAWRDVRKSE